MIFQKTTLNDALLIKLDLKKDDRGFFARTFCVNELKDHGVDFSIVQCNVSHNNQKGTLRGMHLQKKPHEEGKIVSCIAGSVFDVIIDLRPESSTFCQWYGVELSAENRSMLYIPPGFAHGFQTLAANSTMHYLMSHFYYAESASGVRWNDPCFAIQWKLPPVNLSEKDYSYPDFESGF